MAFNRWLEGLPAWLKIVIAIFWPFSILWVIYMFIRDFPTRNATIIIVDIIFGLIPLWIVCYIFNIIWVIQDGKACDLKRIFGLE